MQRTRNRENVNISPSAPYGCVIMRSCRAHCKLRRPKQTCCQLTVPRPDKVDKKVTVCLYSKMLYWPLAQWQRKRQMHLEDAVQHE